MKYCMNVHSTWSINSPRPYLEEKARLHFACNLCRSLKRGGSAVLDLWPGCKEVQSTKRHILMYTSLIKKKENPFLFSSTSPPQEINMWNVKCRLILFQGALYYQSCQCWIGFDITININTLSVLLCGSLHLVGRLKKIQDRIFQSQSLYEQNGNYAGYLTDIRSDGVDLKAWHQFLLNMWFLFAVRQWYIKCVANIKGFWK